MTGEEINTWSMRGPFLPASEIGQRLHDFENKMLFRSGNPKNPGVPTEPQSTRRSDQGPPPPRPGFGPFKLRFPPLHDRTLSSFSGRQAVSWATFTPTPQAPPHLNDHPLPSSLWKWPHGNDFQESCWTWDCLEIQHQDAPGSSVQPFSVLTGKAQLPQRQCSGLGAQSPQLLPIPECVFQSSEAMGTASCPGDT